MGGYVVERYWPGVTEAEVWSLGWRLRETAVPGVTYLGCVLMPDDEVVLCRFDAVTSQAVRTITELVGLRCDRLAAATFIDPI